MYVKYKLICGLVNGVSTCPSRAGSCRTLIEEGLPPSPHGIAEVFDRTPVVWGYTLESLSPE